MQEQLHRFDAIQIAKINVNLNTPGITSFESNWEKITFFVHRYLMLKSSR
jgi:hypothetical protein